MSAIGIGSCFFVENIIYVTILWGIVYGIGLGFSTALLPAIINLYFEDNKSKANGFVLAGSAAGGFVEPGIASSLINGYGLNGLYLILGGVILNGIPAAMVLKVRDHLKETLKQNMSKNSSIQSHRIYDDNMDHETQNQAKNIDSERDLKVTQKILSEILSHKKQPQKEPVYAEYINYSFDMHEENKIVEKVIELKNTQKSTVEIENDANFREINGDKNWSFISFKCMPHSERILNDPVMIGKPSISNSAKQTNVDLEPKEISEEEGDNADCLSPLLLENSEKEKCSWESFRVFLQPTFLLIMATQSLYVFVLSIVWTTIIDVVRDKGIPRDQEIYFMMFLPAADIFGRLGLGFITDGGYLSQTIFSMVSFMCYGLGVWFIAIAEGFVLIMLAQFFFSFFAGGLIAVFPGVVNEFIEEDYKNMAFASRWLLSAPLTLTTSPLIGFFRENLGSYNGLYYMCSVINFSCCVMVLFIPVLARRAKRDLRLIKHEWNY